QLEAIPITLDDRGPKRLLGGEMIMDGGILHAQLGRDMSVTETVIALVLQQRLSQVQNRPLCIGASWHWRQYYLLVSKLSSLLPPLPSAPPPNPLDLGEAGRG